MEKGTAAPFLEPVLTYQMILPEGADTTKVLRELKQLEEEEPLDVYKRQRLSSPPERLPFNSLLM